MTKALFVLGAISLLFSSTVSAVLIDFESTDTSSTGGVMNGNPYFEDGYQIVAGFGELYAFEDGWQNNRGSSNGTTVASIFSGGPGLDAAFSLTRADGAEFDLFSIDLAEFFNAGDAMGAGGSTVYTFTGSKAGTSVNRKFKLDGLSDGPGGAADFETLTFGTEWSGISSLFVSALNPSNTEFLNYMAFDNISVTTVAPLPTPIPAAAWLFGTAVLGLAGFHRRRKAA